ncbi:hypothetical protein BJ170DRAFT_687617 [Xylariales sp. AK1849]|nr:hypothetical protein BJ170DRAFT_687617 [Xylariales sp. AK1849]
MAGRSSLPSLKERCVQKLFGSNTIKIKYQPVRRNSSDSLNPTTTPSDELENGTIIRKRRRGRRRGYFICGSIWVLTIAAIFIFVDLVLAMCRSLWGLDYDPDKIFKKWGEPGTGTEGLKWYPTDFLRDVQPIRCHSHNDYWRTVPLFSALHAGCIGVEADVWLLDDDEKLYVGHKRSALTVDRTFESLYINPLVDLLNGTNPFTVFYNETNSKNGVFDVDLNQTLTLLVDVKTDGAKTWPHVLAQLEPLRSRGWLSYVENGVRHDGPITVVGTGNTPFDLVIANSTYRYAFFDAPLDEMWEDPDSNDTSSSTESFVYNSTNSHYTSVRFNKAVRAPLLGISDNEMRTIRGQVKGAHRRGLKARYWDLPGWPVGLRDDTWHTLVTEGVDMLNVDDLWSASRLEW